MFSNFFPRRGFHVRHCIFTRVLTMNFSNYAWKIFNNAQLKIVQTRSWSRRQSNRQYSHRYYWWQSRKDATRSRKVFRLHLFTLHRYSSVNALKFGEPVFVFTAAGCSARGNVNSDGYDSFQLSELKLFQLYEPYCTRTRMQHYSNNYSQSCNYTKLSNQKFLRRLIF